MTHDTVPCALLAGASGRMGRAIRERAEETGALRIGGRIARDGTVEETPGPEGAGSAIRVVVDFSVPELVDASCRAAEARGAALLVGTTGLGPAERRRLDEAAGRVAVMEAPNVSLGIAALRRAVIEVARMLPDDFAIDLVEVHHQGKRDAPSGTALRIAADLAEVGRPLGPGRIHSLRSGDAPGEHEVRFTGQQQVLRLVHEARSRGVFAAGAVHAAAWLAGRPAGRYVIEDALSGAGAAGPAPG